MGNIEKITEINWLLGIITLFAILFAGKEMIEIISYFRTKLRIKFGYESDKESVDERIAKLEKHDKWQYEEITKIANGVDNIGKKLTEMQIKMDETEKEKLKNDIVDCYKKYKDVGEWSKLESDAFWGLFRRYEVHGGNGYCHTVIEPIMRELNVTD